MLIQRNFLSKVDISLSNEQVKPGENVSISINTKPNSYVGILGVDQSVLVLKSGNDIERSTVFDDLEKYNQVDQYNYEYAAGYDYTSYRDFQTSETVIITNAKKEFGKISLRVEFSFREVICLNSFKISFRKAIHSNVSRLSRGQSVRYDAGKQTVWTCIFIIWLSWSRRKAWRLWRISRTNAPIRSSTTGRTRLES
jgi:Alpha-2-macroglobulin bait region domain